VPLHIHSLELHRHREDINHRHLLDSVVALVHIQGGKAPDWRLVETESVNRCGLILMFLLHHSSPVVVVAVPTRQWDQIYPCWHKHVGHWQKLLPRQMCHHHHGTNVSVRNIQADFERPSETPPAQQAVAVSVRAVVPQLHRIIPHDMDSVLSMHRSVLSDSMTHSPPPPLRIADSSPANQISPQTRRSHPKWSKEFGNVIKQNGSRGCKS